MVRYQLSYGYWIICLSQMGSRHDNMMLYDAMVSFSSLTSIYFNTSSINCYFLVTNVLVCTKASLLISLTIPRWKTANLIDNVSICSTNFSANFQVEGMEWGEGVVQALTLEGSNTAIKTPPPSGHF